MAEIRTLKITGPAGTGIKSAGLLLQKIIETNGYFSFGYTEYPSLIRGGDNTYQIDFSTRPIQSSTTAVEILVALTKECYQAHTHELSPHGIALVEESVAEPSEQTLVIPIKTIIAENNLPPIMENTIYIGAVLGILNFKLEEIKAIVAEAYKTMAEQNVLAIEKGYALGQKLNGRFLLEAQAARLKKNATKNELLTANEAVAKAFIDAKGEFFTSYPMTPATSILHFLAKNGPKAGVLVRQAASEIEAIGLCAGASYAGKRCMTATSGGGFALMNEFISFLGGAEVPLLIVASQRPAPATGLPTWTEQGDLLFAIHAGHGDFPKVVLAPGDQEEAYYLTADALNLAEKFQIPVIMLLDKHLSEGIATISDFDKTKLTVEHGRILDAHNSNPENLPWKRYSLDTKDGVSTRAFPGTPGGVHLTNSDEHDEYGYSLEGGKERSKMIEKRMKKLNAISTMLAPTQSGLPRPKAYGEPDADTLIIGWGSTKGAILDAIEELSEQTTDKHSFKFVQIQYLWPFPDKAVVEETATAKKVILIENNYSAQLGTLLRQAGIKIDQTITKYDGKPFFRDELVSKLKAIR